MKISSTLQTRLVLLLIVLPFFYAAAVYTSLPETVPIHFGVDGTPNGFTGKSSLWIILLLLAALAAGMYFLFKNLPSIDPKKTAGQSPELFNKIALILAIFIVAVNFLVVYAANGGSMQMNRLILPFLGLFFLVLGNLMFSIKPNYFVGFRLPWTLEDPDNWRKTHQVVGKIWVPGGLLIMIGEFIFPPKAAYLFFLSVVAVMIVVPAVYSYQYFKKHKN